MKLNLTDKDLQLIRDAGIPFDINKDYDFWDLDEILNEIYFNESVNVEHDDYLADLYGDLADKIEDQRAVVYGR